MKLLVYPLRTTLTQDFTTTEKCKLGAIRPYLYIHNDPAGTFTITLKHNGTTIEAVSLTMAQILSNAGLTASQYHHGYVTFELSTIRNLGIGETYNIELSSSGYTYGSSYLGWVKEFENEKFPDGLALELWKYKEGKMRVLDFFDGYSSASVPTVDELEMEIDGYMYWRQSPGVDSENDYRWRIDSGVMKLEKYISSVWEIAETFNRG